MSRSMPSARRRTVTPGRPVPPTSNPSRVSSQEIVAKLKVMFRKSSGIRSAFVFDPSVLTNSLKQTLHDIRSTDKKEIDMYDNAAKDILETMATLGKPWIFIKSFVFTIITALLIVYLPIFGIANFDLISRNLKYKPPINLKFRTPVSSDDSVPNKFFNWVLELINGPYRTIEEWWKSWEKYYSNLMADTQHMGTKIFFLFSAAAFASIYLRTEFGRRPTKLYIFITLLTVLIMYVMVVLPYFSSSIFGYEHKGDTKALGVIIVSSFLPVLLSTTIYRACIRNIYKKLQEQMDQQSLVLIRTTTPAERQRIERMIKDLQEKGLDEVCNVYKKRKLLEGGPTEFVFEQKSPKHIRPSINKLEIKSKSKLQKAAFEVLKITNNFIVSIGRMMGSTLGVSTEDENKEENQEIPTYASVGPKDLPESKERDIHSHFRLFSEYPITKPTTRRTPTRKTPRPITDIGK